MYAGFNLNVSQSQGLTPYIDFSQYRTQGKTHLATQENAVSRPVYEICKKVHGGTILCRFWHDHFERR